MIPRREIPVLTKEGQFSRAWYQSLTATAQSALSSTDSNLYIDSSTTPNVITISSKITAYRDGLIRYVKPANTNTSTAITLSDTGLPAKPVRFAGGILPAVGQIVAGSTLQLQYDGAAFIILNLSTPDQTIPGNLSVGGTAAISGNATIGGNATVVGNSTIDGTLDVVGLATLHTVDSAVRDDAGSNIAIGYKGIPQVLKNASYTTVLADRNKHLYHNDANPYTWTIDSNANVAYPIGTELTFINRSSNVGGIITLAVSSDVLSWIGGGTGSRSLAQKAWARALKVESTVWVLDGTGIS